MAGTATKRRNVEDEVRRPKKKIRKFKKQKEYHSSSEDEDDAPSQRSATGVNAAAVSKNRLAPRTKPESSIAALTERDAQATAQKDVSSDEEEQEEEEDEAEDDQLQINTALNMSAHDDSEEDDNELEDAENEDENHTGLDNLDDDDFDDDLMDEFDSDDASESAGTTKKKRNDPVAFATSISKILTTKLSTQKRIDPILSRSKTADEANKALADEKLETKARAAIRAEKKSLLERGRVSDVLGLQSPGVDTGAIMEEEKLKKTAQRGVVKLFNAVRAAQVKAEEAGRITREEGLVGMHKREERVNEMSKEGFLDLISRGGKAPIET
ncbi:hypothetical protein AMS68_007302 [Peltaster fructicola]|uniref:Rrp15p-domain-containing protein n=1 Tax=Peltaster fructicola TaxID=286661 RepID=A0A6H0Y4D2_9PEZI|nr:hypothetical protein AMS68_007302 [Peltaster fructicola]